MSNELITRNGFISRDTSSIIGNLNVTGSSTFTGSISGSSLSANSINLSGITLETAWTSYNPVWSAQTSSPSLGDGTLTGAYKQIGKTVFVRVKLNWGTTTSGGTGAWMFSLPVAAASADGIQMCCSMLDNGNAWYQGILNGTYLGLTTTSAIICQSSGGANSSQGVDSTFPFTWGNSDSLQFAGSYESV